MGKQITVKPIDVEKIETKTADVVTYYNTSKNIVIIDQAGYEQANELLKKIKSRMKELDTERKTITVPLDDAKKAAMELFRKPMELLQTAETVIKKAMITHTAEQEAKARAEQERLRKLAEAEAEKKRKAVQAKIARAEAAGKTEKAEELELLKETIEPIAVPVIAPAIETPKGISYRDKWTAQVIDESLVPREYLMVNQQALDKVAQATKGTLKIAGVKFIVEKIVSSRG